MPAGLRPPLSHFFSEGIRLKMTSAEKRERRKANRIFPLFLIFDPDAFPELNHFVELWQKLAKENGLAGIHFVGKMASVGKFDQGVSHDYLSDARKRYDSIFAKGMDAVNSVNLRRAEMISVGKYKKMAERLLNKLVPSSKVEKYDYAKIIENLFTEEDKDEFIYPTIVPRWDKTPRLGKQAYVYTNSTPALFEKSARQAVEMVQNKQPEHRIIFLQAWNEWGEGNFMEPDLEFGHGYLDALKNALS